MERRRISVSNMEASVSGMLCVWLLSCLIISTSQATRSSHGMSTFRGPKIGVNYGRLGYQLPPIEQVVKLVSSLSVTNVKTFDIDPAVIKAFANTGISLSLCIPNGDIPSLATDHSKSYVMVKDLVLPFYPATLISTISIGNEVSMLPEYASTLLPAIQNVYRSLKRFGLHRQIKVSTPHSLAVLAIRFPPSQAIFQESIAEPVLRPVLAFLSQTRSPFMVNLYPYLTYREMFPYIPLDFALFTQDPQSFNFTDPKTGLLYTNLFDLLVDALASAAESLGFKDLELVVTETGWPSEGSPDDAAASLRNAEIFNRKLVEHVNGVPIKGTPMRPGVPVVTFIFALLDEDMKVGAPTEQHWGLFYANGTEKYAFNVSS